MEKQSETYEGLLYNEGANAPEISVFLPGHSGPSGAIEFNSQNVPERTRIFPGTVPECIKIFLSSLSIFVLISPSFVYSFTSIMNINNKCCCFSCFVPKLISVR